MMICFQSEIKKNLVVKTFLSSLLLLLALYKLPARIAGYVANNSEFRAAVHSCGPPYIAMSRCSSLRHLLQIPTTLPIVPEPYLWVCECVL